MCYARSKTSACLCPVILNRTLKAIRGLETVSELLLRTMSHGHRTEIERNGRGGNFCNISAELPNLRNLKSTNRGFRTWDRNFGQPFSRSMYLHFLSTNVQEWNFWTTSCNIHTGKYFRMCLWKICGSNNNGIQLRKTSDTPRHRKRNAISWQARVIT